MPGCGLPRHGWPYRIISALEQSIHGVGVEWRKQSSDMQRQAQSTQEEYITRLGRFKSVRRLTLNAFNENVCVRCPTIHLYIMLISQILSGNNRNALIGHHRSISLNPFHEDVQCPTIYLCITFINHVLSTGNHNGSRIYCDRINI